MATSGLHSLPTEWSRALGWYRRRADKPEQASLLRIMLRELRVVALDTPSLFVCAQADHTWMRAAARELSPFGWLSLGITEIRDAAFAIRFVELETHRSIDTSPLPCWIGEWAT